MFTVTPTPPSLGTIDPGDFVEVDYAFGGVGADTSGTVTEEWHLAAEVVITALSVTLTAPNPTNAGHSVPSPLQRQLLLADDTHAVVRYWRD